MMLTRPLRNAKMRLAALAAVAAAAALLIPGGQAASAPERRIYGLRAGESVARAPL